MNKFLAGFGAKVAGGWADALATPAFLFWVGGLVASTLRHGLWWLELEESEQIALAAAGLVAVLMSAAVVRRFDLATLRILEGYWPRALKGLTRWLTRRQSDRIDRDQARVQELMQRFTKPHETGTAEHREGLEEMAELEDRLAHAPLRPEHRMPTDLGNVLRAAEIRPGEKYGLNAVICWPRLWLVLPETARSELSEARASLDVAARAWLWCLLFTLWAVWEPWFLALGLLAAPLAYRRAVASARVYGDLLESTFDVHRTLLYQSLRWPLPANPAAEHAAGQRLTAYLWRGSEEARPTFESGGT